MEAFKQCENQTKAKTKPQNKDVTHYHPKKM
jgi:hypothetical protein